MPPHHPWKRTEHPAKRALHLARYGTLARKRLAVPHSWCALPAGPCRRPRARIPCPQGAGRPLSRGGPSQQAAAVRSLRKFLARKARFFLSLKRGLPARRRNSFFFKTALRARRQHSVLSKPPCGQGANIRSLQNRLAGKAGRSSSTDPALPASFHGAEQPEVPSPQGGIGHPAGFALLARLSGNSDAEIFFPDNSRAGGSDEVCTPSAFVRGTTRRNHRGKYSKCFRFSSACACAGNERR
jgi:hypothetical protein